MSKWSRPINGKIQQERPALSKTWIRKGGNIARERAKKNLVALGVEELTDEQVTNYLNQHNGEVKKYQEDTGKWKKEAEKAEELQTKLNGLEQQDLTELEKEKKAREAAEKRMADLQKQLTTSAVEAIFVKANLSNEEFSGMVDALSGLDLEAVKTSAESFIDGISKHDEANKTQWQRETFDKTPNPGTGDKPDPARDGEEESATAGYAKQYSQEHDPQPTLDSVTTQTMTL